MEQTLAEMKAEVVKAFARKRPLAVKGYRSSSEGTVTDYDIILGTPTLYKELVRDSLGLLRDLERDAGTALDVWVEARQQLEASWKRYLEEGPKGSNFQVDLTGDGDGVWYNSKVPQPEHVGFYIRNLLVNSKDVLEATKAAVKSKPVTLAKRAIEARLPIGSYMPMMLLAPGKCVSVKAL
jgi:hypothetical protein